MYASETRTRRYKMKGNIRRRRLIRICRRKLCFGYTFCLIVGFFVFSFMKINLINSTYANAKFDFEQNQILEQNQPVIFENENHLYVMDEEPSNYYYDVPLSHDLQDYIYQLAQEYDLPVPLVFAIIEQESQFDSNARSSTNDTGLMQVNDCNLSDLEDKFNTTDLYDPYQNIESGIYILSICWEAGNQEINPVMMCYNCGISGARNLWNDGIYSTKYSRSVASLYEKYCIVA